jgi:hypothetical protein
MESAKEGRGDESLVDKTPGEFLGSINESNR